MAMIKKCLIVLFLGLMTFNGIVQAGAFFLDPAMFIDVNATTHQLTPIQLDSIQKTLKQFIHAQIDGTKDNVAIIKAIDKAAHDPRVMEAGRQIIQSLKQFIHIFMNTVSLASDQAYKLHSLLKTVEELVALNIDVVQKGVVDQTTQEKIEKLKVQFYEQSMPLLIAKEQVYGPFSKDDTELFIAQAILSLVQEALSIMTRSVNPELLKSKDKKVVNEPVVPERMEMNQDEDEDDSQEIVQ